MQKHKRTKPRNTTVCAGHFSGMLMGQPVLVGITGVQLRLTCAGLPALRNRLRM